MQSSNWQSSTYVLEVCEFSVAGGYVCAGVETVLVLGDGVEGDDVRGRVVARVVLLCASSLVGGAGGKAGGVDVCA
jgi:hypothetical protein